MQRDDHEPQASSYGQQEGTPRASISPPIAPVAGPAIAPGESGKPSAVSAPPRTAAVRDMNGRLLAFVSLAVAMTGLAYNTWRNETTEAHRNVRQSCFILLEESAALQQLVHIRFYGSDRTTATWVAAWGKATLIRDIGMLTPSRTAQEAQHVFTVWSRQAQAIDQQNPVAEEEISDAIERLRRQTLQDLRELD